MRSVSKLFGVQYNTVKDWVKIFKKNRSLQNQSPFSWGQAFMGTSLHEDMLVETSKVNLSELYQQVLEYPDRFQYEHAQTFGVTQSAGVDY
jgi:transposase